MDQSGARRAAKNASSDDDVGAEGNAKASAVATGGITALQLKRARGQRSESKRNLFRDILEGQSASGFTSIGSDRIVSFEDLLNNRRGPVLDNRSILKVDYIPPCDSSDFFPVDINGTYNLRQSPVTKIFGTAQPTVVGVRGILNMLGARRDVVLPDSMESTNRNKVRKSVLWINLREEPTLYVNGRSTVLRTRDQPFKNLDQLRGINETRIESLEKRLKEDFVEEATRYNGNVVLHTEKHAGRLEASWEAVRLNDILTMDEVFYHCRVDGYRVEYVRIPLTPEKAPHPYFFDLLIDSIRETSPFTTIVFNCQTGVSRSTVGLVAAGLLQLRRGIVSIPKEVDNPKIFEALDTAIQEPKADSEAFDVFNEEIRQSSNDAVSRQLEAGWYQITLNLIRLLERGQESKNRVDFFCQDGSALVNIREHIFKLRSSATRERYHPSEQFKLKRAATALLRYLLLIAFDSYMHSQSSLKRDTQSGVTRINGPVDSEDSRKSRETFQKWISSRKEIWDILESVENQPEAALEALDIPSCMGLEKATMRLLNETVRPDMRDLICSRRGNMLSVDTILKCDHYSDGMIEEQLVHADDVLIKGAPNFREINGLCLYGVCTPTLDAVDSVVRYIQAANNANLVVWTNLREEPMVYINKQPFILRNLRSLRNRKPFENVDLLASVDPVKLEQAEVRLKNDVIAEAARFDGRIVIHAESEDRRLEVLWENISEDDVLTPREAFLSRAEAGLPIDYARVPLLPELPPTCGEVDSILNRIRPLVDKPGVHFVFSSQLGRARATTALCIAMIELQRNQILSNVFNRSLGFRDQDVLRNRLSDVASTKGDAPDGSAILEDQDSWDGNPSFVDQGNETLGFYVPVSSPLDRSLASLIPSDEFIAVTSLVRLLPNGVAAKKWLDSVLSKCGQMDNIRESVFDSLRQSVAVRTTEQADEWIQRALLNLRRYFMLIVASAFQLYSPIKERNSFRQWFEKRRELKTFFDGIVDKRSLQLVGLADQELKPFVEIGSMPVDTDSHADKTFIETDTELRTRMEIFKFVRKRNGSVLTSGSILKNDHFPGCDRIKGSKTKLEGVPNFRSITTSLDPKLNINIFGSGIPTCEGLKGVLNSILKQRSNEKPADIVWINLREEPILYINNNPFVLRKQDHPYENLQHTGINRERVIDMEDRLKVDVINEVIENGGCILLHEEEESGLSHRWVQVDVSEGSTAVQTPSELYAMLSSEYPLSHFRVPITDEMAPKNVDYDLISQIVRNAKPESSLVFNCQMGRGRTTTGLCIGLAVRLWEDRKLTGFPDNFQQLVESARKQNTLVTKRACKNTKDRGKTNYLEGWYTSTGAIQRLLTHGGAAKSIMDSIIDCVDTVQNLREAIYALKEASESEKMPPEQRTAALSRGIQYLRRYFQLLTFVDYLIGISPHDRDVSETFDQWIRKQDELKRQLGRVSLE